MVTWESDTRQPRHPFSAQMAGVNPGPVPVHRALPSSCRRAQTAHRDVDHLVSELQLGKYHGPQTSLDHGKPPLHHDKDDTTICSASCNCGSTIVFSTAAPENLQGHTTGKSATASTNWRISLVRQESGPWEAASAHQQGREPTRPANRDIDHLTLWSKKSLDHGNLPLSPHQEICTTCIKVHRPAYPHATGESLWSQ